MGLVFEAPATFNKTFWRRDGLWSVYPEDHISRPVGEADLFYSRFTLASQSAGGTYLVVEPRLQ